jgi:hypothetical protein
LSRSSSVTFSLTFYRGGRPNFEKGDKYCPIEYAPVRCVLCNSPLVFNPRRTSVPEEWKPRRADGEDADVDELLGLDDGEGGATGLVMTFRLSSRAKEGEKYCSKCNLVHPPDYYGYQCVRCRNPLQDRRTGDRPWIKAIYAEPADGEALNR